MSEKKKKWCELSIPEKLIRCCAEIREQHEVWGHEHAVLGYSFESIAILAVKLFDEYQANPPDLSVVN
jgi:hypothetical protein